MPAFFLVVGFVVAIAIATGRHRKHEVPSKPHEVGHAPPSPAADTVELDHGMPPELVHQVLAALAEEDQPTRLQALARSLEPHYPLSGFALRARAEALAEHAALAGGRGSGAAATDAHPALPPAAAAHAPHLPPPAAEGSAAHAAPAVSPAPPAATLAAPGPHSSPKELHAAAVLQAAMRALVEELDPVVLDGFAESIHEAYPMAASLLAQHAQALRTAAHAPPTPALSAPPAPPPGPGAGVAALATPSPMPAAESPT